MRTLDEPVTAGKIRYVAFLQHAVLVHRAGEHDRAVPGVAAAPVTERHCRHRA